MKRQCRPLRGAEEENLEFLGWREVPVNPDVLGTKALNSMPHIMQAFIEKAGGLCKGSGI
mgnify:CR=1 FL=1